MLCEIALDALRKRRAAIHQCGVELHQAGAGTYQREGIGAASNTAHTNDRHAPATQPVELRHGRTGACRQRLTAQSARLTCPTAAKSATIQCRIRRDEPGAARRQAGGDHVFQPGFVGRDFEEQRSWRGKRAVAFADRGPACWAKRC
jgi:hypothetical protein